MVLTESFAVVFPAVFLLHEVEELLFMRRWMGRHASPLMRRFPRMKPLSAVLARVRTGAFAAAAAAAELFSVRELVLWGLAGLFWLRPTCARCTL